MSDIDVQRARFNLLARQKADARKKRTNQTTIGQLKNRAGRFIAPIPMATNLWMGSPSIRDNQTEEETDSISQSDGEEANDEDVETEEESAIEADAADKLASQQAIARNLQARQTTATQEAQTEKVEEDKKQKEEVARMIVRPAQHSIFTGSILGGETVVAFIFGSALWLVWKTLELYKTVTGASFAVFDDKIIAWNNREKLEFICGAMVIVFVGVVVTSFVSLIVYVVLNPAEGSKILPGIAETLNFI